MVHGQLMEHVIYLVHILLINLFPIITRHEALLLRKWSFLVHVELDAGAVIEGAISLLLASGVRFADLDWSLVLLGLLLLHVVIDLISLVKTLIGFWNLVAQTELLLLDRLHPWREAWASAGARPVVAAGALEATGEAMSLISELR